MTKVLEWLIATLASVLLGYLLVDRAGLPVWGAAGLGVVLIVMGMVLGRKEKP